MTVLRSWAINGDDGNIYTVEECESSAIRVNHGKVRSGIVEYQLDDGTDLVDDTPGHWITSTGVLLKHPDNL